MNERGRGNGAEKHLCTEQRKADTSKGWYLSSQHHCLASPSTSGGRSGTHAEVTEASAYSTRSTTRGAKQKVKPLPLIFGYTVNILSFRNRLKDPGVKQTPGQHEQGMVLRARHRGAVSREKPIAEA